MFFRLALNSVKTYRKYMFKFIKVLFFLILIFVGLYFFGNFRINDTNVRDTLQRHITVTKISALKDELVQFYHKVARLFLPTTKVQDKPTINPVTNKPLETISQKDREKMFKLLQKNLKDLSKNQK